MNKFQSNRLKVSKKTQVLKKPFKQDDEETVLQQLQPDNLMEMAVQQNREILREKVQLVTAAAQNL